MPPITALLHTLNDEDRLGRALESLRSCDEILVVDGGSRDDTVRIARLYGATVYKEAESAAPTQLAASAWVLCVLPSETVTETLESALYEWKLYGASDVAAVSSASVFLREETEHGWSEAVLQTRLIRREFQEWDGRLPKESGASMRLQGELLRFRR